MNSKESIKLPISIKLAVLLLTALVAVLFYLVLRPDSASQLSNSLANNISIRQDQDNIQWKLPGSDWQTITTVSELTAGAQGRPGKDGADGKDGAAGKDGVNGQDGADGQNGTDGAPGAQGATGAAGLAGQNGTNGTDGAQGAQGIQGIQGEQGAQGEQGIQGTAGANGQDGQDGIDGREIELQKDLYYIQWRYVGEPGWRNLIAYSDLKGEKGDTGATGPANNLSIGAVNRTTCTPTASITGTAPSQTLNLGIPGLPTGGTAGQVLTKNSNTDCDTSWQNTGELKGNGMPNGTVTAPVGTYYTDTAGTNGAWRWLKTTGAGNTGWTVVYGDTGERRHSTPYLLNGYTQYLTYPHISPHVTRVGDIVYWSGSFASIQEGLVNGGEILDVPLGFRPAVGGVNGIVRSIGGGDTVITSITVNSGKLRFTHPGNVPTNLTYGMIQFSYVTNDPWPVELPGEAG